MKVQSIFDRVRLLRLREPGLDPVAVGRILNRHGVHKWFFYAYTDWKTRWHVWRGIYWAIRNIPTEVKTLETGCGCGWNLLWLAANGFSALYGYDIDAAAVAAGRELAAGCGLPIVLWQDDGLAPHREEGDFGLILALNWTYHVAEFGLSSFLTTFSSFLADGGCLIIDVIDKGYDRYPLNAYLTSDWEKPEKERRGTEYLHRYSSQEVYHLAASCGYQVVFAQTRAEVIPRSLFILRKRS